MRQTSPLTIGRIILDYPQIREKDYMFQKSLLIITVALSLSACAGSGSQSLNNDPFERTNSFMFRVNVQLDNYILKPVAKGYLYVPSPVRRSVRNFLDNLASPVTLVNDILQL